MHNIGRTVREMHENNFEHQHQEVYQSEFDAPAQEYESAWENEYETGMQESYAVSPFNEMMEMEMATELLGVQNEEELDHFLSKLMSRAAPQGTRNAGRSNTGRMLGGVLKRVAKFALPMAGRIVGGMFGGPVGAKLGSSLGNMATRAFGLELEGLSAEDQEFEQSKAFVRFAGAAAREVQNDPKSRTQPKVAVRAGVIRAAQALGPGLLVPMPGAYRVNRDKGVYDHRDYEGFGPNNYSNQEF